MPIMREVHRCGSVRSIRRPPQPTQPAPPAPGLKRPSLRTTPTSPRKPGLASSLKRALTRAVQHEVPKAGSSRPRSRRSVLCGYAEACRVEKHQVKR